MVFIKEFILAGLILILIAGLANAAIPPFGEASFEGNDIVGLRYVFNGIGSHWANLETGEFYNSWGIVSLNIQTNTLHGDWTAGNIYASNIDSMEQRLSDLGDRVNYLEIENKRIKQALRRHEWWCRQ